MVFDGYCNGPSPKDMTHLQRKHAKESSDISFDGDMLVEESRESFLANEHNKQQLINMIGTALENVGVSVHHAEHDADCLIARVTLNEAENNQTLLVGQDTDLLVLLLHHCKQESCRVFLDTGKRLWDIQFAQRRLGEDMCKQILFCHAVGGCDTTSGLFSVGKSAPCILLKKSEEFQIVAEKFNQTHLSDIIVKAGETALVLLYGGKHSDSLNHLRCLKYCQKLHSFSSALEPKHLPPTSSAAQFHSLRTYFQVQEWKTLNGVTFDMDPKDWGWTIKDSAMIPVMTNLSAAPEELLNSIRCNCKTDCASSRCSCRRHGLACSLGCGDCRGESCSNRNDVT